MAAAEFPIQGLSELSRTLALIEAADVNIRRKFLELIGNARGVRSLEEIEGLISTGRIAEAVDVMNDVGPGLNQAITAAFVAAGVSVSGVLQQELGSTIQFDTLGSRGVLALQASGSRLIRELSSQQASATAQALQDGIRDGLAPSQIARRVRGSIGLTQVQTAAVANYRRLLTGLSSEALTRQLRDSRSDGIIRRAIQSDTPLTDAQIGSLVDRYEQNQLRHRAGVIAATESVSAINQGEHEMWQQAVDRGEVNPRLVEQVWSVLDDGAQRDSHGTMQGQVRMLGVPFQSGKGAYLRFPGDPNASVGEVIRCRCGVFRRFIPNPF